MPGDVAEKALLKIGDAYGAWVVVESPEVVRSASGKTRSRVRCRCVCGTVKPVDAYHLRTGATRSCGCERGRLVTAGKSKGLSRHTSAWRKLLLPYIDCCELCARSFEETKAFIEHAHICLNHDKTVACAECLRGMVCMRCNWDIEVLDRWGYPLACAHWEVRRPLKDGAWADHLAVLRERLPLL
jgi:hypothetical protein